MQTMQKLEREAHLLVFPDEGHGLVKLDNKIEGYSKALGFMLSHIERMPRSQTGSEQERVPKLQAGEAAI
jgi:hypothetical protein